MKHVITAASLSLMLFLAGCASSPSARQYVFAPEEGWRTIAVRDASASDYEIRFTPVRLPAYLDRPHIVTRLNKTEIKADQFHRWGIPLDVTIAEILGASVGRALPEAYVDVKPGRGLDFDGYQISVDVVRLDGFLGGDVELIAQWSVNQVGETNRVVAQQLSRYVTTIESKHYEAYIEAVRQNVYAMGKDIGLAISGNKR